MSKPYVSPSVYVQSSIFPLSHYSDEETFTNYLRDIAVHSFHSKDLMAWLEQECLNFLKYHLSMGNITKEEFEDTVIKCSYDPITQAIDVDMNNEYPRKR